MIIGKKVFSVVAGTAVIGGGIGIYSYFKSSKTEPYKMPERLVKFDRKDFWGEKPKDLKNPDKDKFIFF